MTSQNYEPEDQLETAPETLPGADTEYTDNENRDAKLERRRARQSGRSTGQTKKVLAATVALLACGGLILILAGPTSIMNLFGEEKEELGKTETSQVGLEVTRIDQPRINLDFTALAPAVDEAAVLKAQLEELQKKLETVSQTPGEGELSQQKIEKMLAEHSKKIEARIAEERTAMAAENLRLHEETLRLQEEARKREEADKLKEENSLKLEEQSNLQRDSKLLIVDEGNADTLRTASTGGDGDGKGQNQEFLAQAADAGFETSVAKPLTNPSRTVVQGTIISGVLETAINTELPGNIRAQVTEPVFSYDGSYVMMPAGTVLIGTFNPEINLEQKRVLIAWNRAITPDGQSIAIGGTGVDLLGRSGTAGNVDNRYGKKIGAAVLVSAISIAPNLIASRISGPKTSSSNDDPSLSLSLGGGGDDDIGALQGVGSAAGEQAAGLLDQYLSLPPVISVPQGEEIRVFVNRDLVFR